MTQLLIDPMNNAANWKALAPDGVAPSSAIALSDEAVEVRFGVDKASGRITAGAGAQGHSLRRSLPNLDLTGFDDIRFWLKGSRVADGSPGRPFYLEMRLASATMGLSDPDNTWKYFLPVGRIYDWDLVRLDLDTLPAPVRTAVNLIELRCVDDSQTFVCFLDDMVAVREAMIGDSDAALLALLHNRVNLNGTPVPAFITHPENPPEQKIPSIRLTQYDIQYVRERTTFDRTRRDYGTEGFRMSPARIFYDLYYFIDVYANSRQDKTQLMEFVLRTLSPDTEIVVNNMQLRLEWVTIEPLDETGKWRSDRELLYFKISTCQESGAFEEATPAYKGVVLQVDQKS
jgi:hypothetical protein